MTGRGAVPAAVVVTACVAAFVTGHLVLLVAGAAVAVVVTFGAVLLLRRFMVCDGKARLADPAARRPSRAVTKAQAAGALPAPPRRAIEAPRRLLTGRVVPPAERDWRGGAW